MRDFPTNGLLSLAFVCFCATAPINAAEETSDGVVVNYGGISQEYAAAIARTVSAARTVAVTKFGFDMPETITVAVQADPNANVRLFNDGQDRFSLTVRTESDLRKPSESGVFHLYGLCHEVAHLAMYRPIRDKRWMTTAAAEGWAHYLGSRIVDDVHHSEGADLWPDRYDYLNDGMRRLEKQLASSDSGEVTRGAGMWKDLVAIIGDRGAAPLFQAWGQLKIDPANPAEQLGSALAKTIVDRRASDWWQQAQTLFVELRPASDFATTAVGSAQLSGPKRELSLDDGRKAGQQSIAGGGHAVRFDVPDDSWYVTSVRVHGSRYGAAQAPKEDFYVWLCDDQFRSIAEFPFPYSTFKRGQFDWADLTIDPTQVPQEFFVCVGFNPTATKGVFVSYDAQTADASYTGLPGRQPSDFSRGNWLIRATVRQKPKTRTWSDATGKFKIEAELVDFQDGQVQLKRASDGQIIPVPMDRLSEADQAFLQSMSQETSEADQEKPQTVSLSQLSGESQELKRDDGKSAGKKSFPMGHAVAFEAPGDSYYMTSIRIHGARYGYPQPPKEDFHVTLCDADFGTIADFPFAYSKFQKGNSTWVSLRVKPTRVPKNFVLCVNFNPTQSKGVFVSHDAEGKALVGKPDKPSGTFSGGDWLIRVNVDKLK